MRGFTQDGYLSVQQIIHDVCHPTEKRRPGDAPADDIVVEIIRVGIWANRKAAPAVHARGHPVADAGLAVDLPAQGVIDLLAVAERDGIAGAVRGAFGADCAEVDH